MSKVAVQTMPSGDPAGLLFGDTNELVEEIRRRAFSLFERRGYSPGRDLDDWLTAESEFLCPPPAELIENEKEFRIRIAVPGFETKDIQVTALPESVVVQTAAVVNHENKDGDVRFSEIGSKRLYRRLDLPSPIDLDNVTASLEKGLLQLVAPKAAEAAEKSIPVTAAAQSA